MVCPCSLDEASWEEFLKGIELFNQREFYDCHDTIEAIWLVEASDQQPFLQGIIQSAVAFYHYQLGNWGAARAMLGLALEKLSPYPKVHCSLRLDALRQELAGWKEALDRAVSRGDRSPLDLPFPTIQRSE